MPRGVAARVRRAGDAMTRKCGRDLLRDGDWRERGKRDCSPNSRREQSSFHWPNLPDGPRLATFSASTTEDPNRKMANRSGDAQWGILPSEWRMQPSSVPARAITLAFRRTEVPPTRCRVGLHGLTD